MKIGSLAIAAIIGIIFVGCNSKPPMVQVEGIVRLNGEPVEGCSVAFYPEAEDANPEIHGYGLAWTDKEGKFSIANAEGVAGIFPGRYKVVLVSFVDKNGNVLPKTAKPSETPGGFFNRMPKEYEHPASSPETVEVKKSGLNVEFNIKK